MKTYSPLIMMARILLCALILLPAAPATAFFFIMVDTGSDVVDAPDLTPSGLTSNPGNDGSISLREAILANNNASPGASVTIMVSGETTRPLTGLPPITRGPVHFMGSGGAEIDGSRMTEPGTGLTIAGPRVRVTDFTVRNFPGDGLRVAGEGIRDSSLGMMTVHGNSGHGLVVDFRDDHCMNYCFLVYNSEFFDNSKSAILSRSGNLRVSDTTVREGPSKSAAPNGGYGLHLDPAGVPRLAIGPGASFAGRDFAHVIEVLEGESVELASTLAIPEGGGGRWYFNQERMLPEDSSTTLTMEAIPYSRSGHFDFRITDGADQVTTRSPSVEVIVLPPADVHAPENILLAFFESNRGGDPFHLTIDDARDVVDHPSMIRAFEELDANGDGILTINEVYRDLFTRARYSIGRVDTFLDALPNETATTSTLNLAIDVATDAGRPLRILDVITFHGSQFTQYFPPAGEGTIQPGDSWTIDLDFHTRDLLDDAGFILLETDNFVLPYVLIPLVTDAFQTRLDLANVLLSRKELLEGDIPSLDRNEDGLVDSADLVALGLTGGEAAAISSRPSARAKARDGDDQVPVAGDLLISTTGYLNSALPGVPR